MEQAPPPDPAAALPSDYQAVLEAHGGLANWQQYRTLSFKMPSESGGETQTIDLQTRHERIEQPGATIGYDGRQTWVKSDGEYEGDPVFYRNLMFYFYAMPWVLADPGVNYSKANPLEFNGTTYPGIKINFDDGIGDSSKDNYFLHYDAGTKQMRWLGYTVTGRSGKTSDNVSWIEYPTWTERGGVALPDSLVWYTKEANLPVAPRNAVHFEDVELSAEAMDEATFAAEAGAVMY